MTITEFLLARIAEDEAVAHAAASRITEGLDWPFFVLGHHRDDDPDAVVAELWLRFDPARVLAECEAKRRIVESHPMRTNTYGPGWGGKPPYYTCGTCTEYHSDMGCESESWPCATIRALASVYSDHPDYDAAWA